MTPENQLKSDISPKKERLRWGRARVLLFAHREMIFDLLDKGYPVTMILEENPNLNVSYSALKLFISKYRAAYEEEKKKKQAMDNYYSPPLTEEQIAKFLEEEGDYERMYQYDDEPAPEYLEDMLKNRL